jgi:hypothetical protein
MAGMKKAKISGWRHCTILSGTSLGLIARGKFTVSIGMSEYRDGFQVL